MRVVDFVKPAIADKSPMRNGEIRTFRNDRLLNLHHLRHVIAARPERLAPDPLVYSGQHFRIQIVTVIDLSQSANKVL